MSPFSKEARLPPLVLDQIEPGFARGQAEPGFARGASAPRLQKEPLAAVAPRRMPTLSAAAETARPFELRVGEPAAVASVLTSGGASASRVSGGFLRKAVAVAIAGLALVGVVAIVHSLGFAMPL